MSGISPDPMIVRRPYRKELKTVDAKAKEILNERYKGERTTFRHNNQRFIVPFSAEDYKRLTAKYNQEIKLERQQRRNALAREKRAVARQQKLENAESTFIIHLTLRGTFHKTFYDPTTKIRHKVNDVITWNTSTHPMTEKNAATFIPDYVANDIEHDDGYKVIEVLNYTVEDMSVPQITKTRRSSLQQPILSR